MSEYYSRVQVSSILIKNSINTPPPLTIPFPHPHVTTTAQGWLGRMTEGGAGAVASYSRHEWKAKMAWAILDSGILKPGGLFS